MTAEQIVRALARCEEPLDDSRAPACLCRLCQATGTSTLDGVDVVHTPHCPWRMAREWAATNPWPTHMSTLEH